MSEYEPTGHEVVADHDVYAHEQEHQDHDYALAQYAAAEHDVNYDHGHHVEYEDGRGERYEETDFTHYDEHNAAAEAAQYAEHQEYDEDKVFAEEKYLHQFENEIEEYRDGHGLELPEGYDHHPDYSGHTGHPSGHSVVSN
jgi:hypothetical protein